MYHHKYQYPYQTITESLIGLGQRIEEEVMYLK